MTKLKVMISTFLLSATLSQNVMAANYCTGIRGNGELAPAHWSALSRITENKGLPTAAAGGSSASITIFLMDALSRNTNLSSNEADKNKELGLLFKTMVPHIFYLYNEDAKSPTIMRLAGNLTGLGDGGFIHKLKSAVKIAKDLPEFFEVLGEYGPLLNSEVAKGLRSNFSFYKAQLAESLKVFGSFDAKTDKNIFYRKGLVDFKFLGMIFGRVADFYAGYGAEKVNTKMKKFLNTCSDVSFNKEWSEVIKALPICKDLLHASLDAYYEAPTVERRVRSHRKSGPKFRTRTITLKRKFPNRMIFEKVGSGLKAFPTTSLVVGDAAKRYKNLLQRYEENEAKDVDSFSVDFNSELKYGYWGKSEDLFEIKSNIDQLFPTDTKSNKFQPIEGGVWFEVLGTSPAEPGLSNLQRIADGNILKPKSVKKKRYFKKFLGIFPTLRPIGWFDEEDNSEGVVPFREDIYSAGGWSDLHPTLVLKASGCEEIMYITRQGGESVFGQQIFIRLTGYDDKISFWEDIAEKNRIGQTNMTPDEESSPWNKLYNLANPESSFNTSLSVATSVYCTNWDKFYVLKGEINQTLTDAYHAPVFLKEEDKRAEYNFGKDHIGKSVDNFPGCIIQK